MTAKKQKTFDVDKASQTTDGNRQTKTLDSDDLSHVPDPLLEKVRTVLPEFDPM